MEKKEEIVFYDNFAENVIDILNESFGIDKFKIFQNEELLFSGTYSEFKELGTIAYLFGRLDYGRVKEFRYVDEYAELHTQFL